MAGRLHTLSFNSPATAALSSGHFHRKISPTIRFPVCGNHNFSINKSYEPHFHWGLRSISNSPIRAVYKSPQVFYFLSFAVLQLHLNDECCTAAAQGINLYSLFQGDGGGRQLPQVNTDNWAKPFLKFASNNFLPLGELSCRAKSWIRFMDCYKRRWGTSYFKSNLQTSWN